VSEFRGLNAESIAKMPEHEFKLVLGEIMSEWDTDRKENAILHYVPVSDEAKKIHLCNKQTVGVGGGNGSSKTETCFADLAMCITGQIPMSLRDEIDAEAKLRGPIRTRVVCESLTTVLHPILLPKLRWYEWTGIDEPGGARGHWGWIPRDCLIGGSWERSWSEKFRTLRVLYRDPFKDNQVTGESMIQFMSRDQDATDFASGDFHKILHDEPPTHAIWRENQARTMRVRGQMMLAMTWPDDPAIAVDWLFDKVYEPAMSDDPNIAWFNLYTQDNPNLDQGAVALQESMWSEEESKVRLRGEPIRFSNRVHQLFTDQTQTWCFPCGKPIYPVEGRCKHCESSIMTEFNHVTDVMPSPSWPTIYLLDPHPRKPHMMAWWQISPQDDLFQVAEAECEGDPTDVKILCDALEGDMSLDVTHRFIDPNMGKSPASSKRGITWQDEFSDAGLACDLADDSGVGRKRIDEYLRPDPHTLEPRIHIGRNCTKTVMQMKRYVWDDHKRALERDLKQTAKTKNDDFPTLMKYLLNAGLTFQVAKLGAPRIRRMPSTRSSHPTGLHSRRSSWQFAR